MARWNPPSNVGGNELIGRRLFDEPLLRGAVDQPSYSGLRLNNFEETRGDEVSLDRLGASGFDHKVSTYLLPRAENAGKTFAKPKSFDGWATVRAKELINAKKPPMLPVFASPVTDPVPNDNIYHAHVVAPSTHEPYMMALHLKHIFTTCGDVQKTHSLGVNQSGNPAAERSFLARSIDMLLSLLRVR
jgi:hypothetical protein